jgi:hypothetical protein
MSDSDKLKMIQIPLRQSAYFGEKETAGVVEITLHLLQDVLDRMTCTCRGEHCMAPFVSEADAEQGAEVAATVIANTFAVLVEAGKGSLVMDLIGSLKDSGTSN